MGIARVSLFLCVIFIMKCNAVIQPHWKNYFVWVIQQHEKCMWAPIIVHAPVPPPASFQEALHSDAFSLPDVIVWDPIKQYPQMSLILNTVCYEEGCGLPLKFFCWQDGRKSRYNPRCLYGVDGITILICQIFTCSKNHFITSCDPRVLSVFPQEVSIPYILLHRSGITLQAYNTIFDMASQGTSFSDIESFFLWQCQEKYTSMESTYRYLNTDKDYCLSPLPRQYISNDLIMQFFITMYNKMKTFLRDSMTSITAEYLSCDHTFKLPKHIGLRREKNWVAQYDSMFIIQSDKGEIMFWQLTKGTAYSAVNDGLKSLQQRIDYKGKKVKMIVIDNCCIWKKKLTNTFGDDVKIKLDIFHAIKRVSGAVSKKHPHFYSCIQDLRLIFRDKGDNGPVRKMSTPSPDVLLSNIQHFTAKWSLEDLGILTQAALKELDHLKSHMQKGCLSEIPSKFGTNRNENLHRSINHRLAGHTIGVELAVALLSVFFHLWNTKRSGKPNTSVLRAASFFKNSTVTNTCFGIGVSNERIYLEEHLGTAFHHTSHKTVQAMEILQSLKRTQPFVDKCARTDTILDILQRALSHLLLEDSLNDISDTHPTISRISMHLTPHIMESQVIDEEVHRKRLANVLKSYNLDTVDIEKDGDCLFSTIATYILLYQTSLSGQLLEHLQNIGICSTMPTSVIVKRLRELLVHDWLCNQGEYQSFFDGVISEGDYEAEVQKYLQSGVFSSALGDAMLYGLSSVIRLPLIVFTSANNWPYLTIHPRSIPVDSTPILIAFLQAGPGHYSLAIKSVTTHLPDSALDLSQTNLPDVTQESKECEEETSCRCGRGRNASNKQKLNCSKSSHYTSRCPCLRSNTGCTTQCACRNCDNPLGKASLSDLSDTIVTRKKRPRHKEQEQARSTSIKYMKMCNEQPSTGRWTSMEHYTLLAIVYHCDKSGRSLDEISDIYDEIIKFIISNDIPISLSGKSKTQVKAKIQQNIKEKRFKPTSILPV